MDRRDFFGVIAAPLLRRLTPPVPVAVQASPAKLSVRADNGLWREIAEVVDIQGAVLNIRTLASAEPPIRAGTLVFWSDGFNRYGGS